MKQHYNKMFWPAVTKLLAGFIVLLLSCVNAVADSQNNILISSDLNHSYHQALVQNLISTLQELQIPSDTSGDEFIPANRDDYSLIITIGYKATSLYLNNDTRPPVLSLLVPQKIYTSMLSSHVNRESQNRFSAIYIDQPIDRQIRLIKYLSPNFHTIGVLLGKHSYSRKSEIQTAIKKNKMDNHTSTVFEPSELIRETRLLTENSDILLAIPDNTIYNRRSIKGILLTTYRQQIPVIGFSSAYVKAGALAAVYSTSDDISTQAKSIIREILKNNNIAIRENPKYFNVAINNKVAHSLNLRDFSQKELLEKLYQDETE